MTSHDDLAELRRLLRDTVPPPDPHRRADARARLLAAIDARDPARQPTISRGTAPPVRSSFIPAPAGATPTGQGRRTAVLVLGAIVVLVVGALAWQVRLATSTPLPVVDGGETAVTVYGDGEISCPNHVADDRSLPVGTVAYFPGQGQIRVVITLTDAAPHRAYGVQLWGDESCDIADHPWGPLGASQPLTTDGNGAGELDYVFTGMAPGTYRVNVNLVDGLFDETRPDFRHREMGAAIFTDVVVDSNGGG